MTSEYLSKVTTKKVVLTFATSTTLTAAVDIHGFQIVGLVTPAALTNDGSLEVTPQIDPDGSDTFYSVMDEAGNVLQWANVSVDELLQMDIDRHAPVVGAQVKLLMGTAEGADRTFKLILEAL